MRYTEFHHKKNCNLRCVCVCLIVWKLKQQEMRTTSIHRRDANLENTQTKNQRITSVRYNDTTTAKHTQ
jgi:hypothetical protein